MAASLNSGVKIKWAAQEDKNPVFMSLNHRIEKGFVDIGRQMVNSGKTTNIWEPVLKTGITAGESWEWLSPVGLYKDTVVSFGDYKGTPSVFIRKLVQSEGSLLATETEHVFVKGIGEVERVTYDSIPSKSVKKRVSELRLVEDPADDAEVDGDPAMPGTSPVSGSGRRKSNRKTHRRKDHKG